MLEKRSIKITGMSCNSCALRLEKGLKNIKGVTDATVNFATEKATVNFNKSVVNIADIQKTIKDIGYDFINDNNELKKVELKISGMSCASCSARIESKLNTLSGVKASVNLATEKATVEFNPELITLETLIKTIKDIGFDAKLIEQNNLSEEEKDIKIIENILN